METTYHKLRIAGRVICCVSSLFAQSANPVIDAMMKEENNHSQVEQLANQLFDEIGSSLVGRP